MTLLLRICTTQLLMGWQVPLAGEATYSAAPEEQQQTKRKPAKPSGAPAPSQATDAQIAVPPKAFTDPLLEPSLLEAPTDDLLPLEDGPLVVPPAHASKHSRKQSKGKTSKGSKYKRAAASGPSGAAVDQQVPSEGGLLETNAGKASSEPAKGKASKASRDKPAAAPAVATSDEPHAEAPVRADAHQEAQKPAMADGPANAGVTGDAAAAASRPGSKPAKADEGKERSHKHRSSRHRPAEGTGPPASRLDAPNAAPVDESEFKPRHEHHSRRLVNGDNSTSRAVGNGAHPAEQQTGGLHDAGDATRSHGNDAKQARRSQHASDRDRKPKRTERNDSGKAEVPAAEAASAQLDAAVKPPSEALSQPHSGWHPAHPHRRLLQTLSWSCSNSCVWHLAKQCTP